MKTHKLDLATGSFSVQEELFLKLDGQEMQTMGWDIADDKPTDQYEIVITGEGIHANILCSNGEWNDSGFTFDYIDTVQDLIRHGYLMIVNEKEEESENGVLQIKP